MAAIRGAFEDTDLIFLEKGQSEVGQLYSLCKWFGKGIVCTDLAALGSRKELHLESPGANLNNSFMAIKHNVGFLICNLIYMAKISGRAWKGYPVALWSKNVCESAVASAVSQATPWFSLDLCLGGVV